MKKSEIPEALELGRRNDKNLHDASIHLAEMIQSGLMGDEIELGDERIRWFVARRRLDLEIAENNDLDASVIDSLKSQISAVEGLVLHS